MQGMNGTQIEQRVALALLHTETAKIKLLAVAQRCAYPQMLMPSELADLRSNAITAQIDLRAALREADIVFQLVGPAKDAA